MPSGWTFLSLMWPTSTEAGSKVKSIWPATRSATTALAAL